MKLCGSLLVLFVSLATPLFADTYHVNSTRDALDANLADGVCWTGSLLPDGTQECTLRAALQEANRLRATRPLHRIHLPAGTFAIGLTSVTAEAEERGQAAGSISTETANQHRDFDLQGDVWITGAGTGATVIDGLNGDRVFDIIGTGLPVNMIFERLSIRRGSTVAPGACLRNLASRGVVYLTDVVVENCVARDGIGGGMLNQGAVIMTRVQFRNNWALRGGGLENRSVALIYDSTFHGNAAQLSTTMASFGGGISNMPGAALTISQSTLSDNSSGAGGGLYNEGNATLVNSTISGNSGRGGGVAFVARGGTTPSPSLWLVSSTLADNQAPGILRVAGGELQLRETIVARNTDVFGRTANCEGGITGSRESLEDANTCGLIGPGDLPNTDPLLGPLASNGGPTQTHALLAGSPAIDAAGAPNERRDQRGFPRPMFGAGDIGAYEKGFEFTLLIPLDWSHLFGSIFTRSETSFRVELSLLTLGKGSADIAEARIVSVKGANGPVQVETSKDGQSLILTGVFSPPKDHSNTTMFVLEVMPGAEKSSQLRFGNITCDCEATPRKNPPPIVIPSAEKIEKQR